MGAPPERKEMGRYEHRPNVSRLASGVYFLWLQSSGTVRTQRLTAVG